MGMDHVNTSEMMKVKCLISNTNENIQQFKIKNIPFKPIQVFHLLSYPQIIQ